VDACRIAGDLDGDPHRFAKTDGGNFASFSEPPVVRAAGRWPANVILSHNPDCREVGTRIISGDEREGSEGALPAGFGDVGATRGYGKGKGKPAGPLYGAQTIPVWECEPDCAIRLLDEQSGERSSGASRFFYTAKASRQDRNTSGADNTHPTVKPADLMRWLIRLVTPPGGIILDPFAGSGSTGVAARAESVRCILIEREAEYLPIIHQRLAQQTLFSEGLRPPQ